MSKPDLTKELAYENLQNFFNETPFVLFGTGTSCSISSGFGMGALEQYLKDNIVKNELNSKQQTEWQAVLDELNNGKDLESSLDKVREPDLINIIVDKTSEKVLDEDLRYRDNILYANMSWPAIAVLKKLLEGLPESNKALNVATTNYDMIAEYAFTSAGISYSTGFCGKVLRRLDWEQSLREMSYVEAISMRGRTKRLARFKNHVRLYKVHGSLNTYKFKDELVETDIWTNGKPEDVERIMITPGISKHEKLHNYRGVLLSKCDEVIKKSNSFLFLGFGFNDNQIYNEHFRSKLRVEGCKGLIITRSKNNRIDEELKHSENMWLVCKGDNDNSTLIYNAKYRDRLILDGISLWNFETFASTILGE